MVLHLRPIQMQNHTQNPLFLAHARILTGYFMTLIIRVKYKAINSLYLRLNPFYWEGITR